MQGQNLSRRRSHQSRPRARIEAAAGRTRVNLKLAGMAALGDGGPLTGGPHDVGGLCKGDPELGDDPDAVFVANAKRAFAQWERETVAMIYMVRQQDWTDGERVLASWDPIRRAIESLPKSVYDSTAYFEKWALGFATCLFARGVMTPADIGEKLGIAVGETGDGAHATRFKAGDSVLVHSEDLATSWAKPHLRTPGYIFGKAGTVERVCGTYDNPELLAIGLKGPAQPLYRVRFKQVDVWPEYVGHPNDSVDVEVYQPWLDSAEVAGNFSCEPPIRQYLAHPHVHEGGEAHAARAEIEQAAVDAEGPERPYRRVVEAIKMALMDKGLITAEGVREYIEKQDMNSVSAALGAQIVAKAWVDPRYKGASLDPTNPSLKPTPVDLLGISRPTASHVLSSLVFTAARALLSTW
jgi:hypothetical protein